MKELQFARLSKTSSRTHEHFKLRAAAENKSVEK